MATRRGPTSEHELSAIGMELALCGLMAVLLAALVIYAKVA